MCAESTRGDIQLCQRRRAKHTQGCGRCSPYLAWVVFYPTGGSDLPERPDSRSVVRQLLLGAPKVLYRVDIIAVCGFGEDHFSAL